MDKEHIKKLAREHGVPFGTVEKDYVLTSLLSVIAGFSGLDRMVFKGGTALKKIHFKGFRFSEDLDFVCLEDVSGDFADFVRDSTGGPGVRFTGIRDMEKKDKSFKFKVQYEQMTGGQTSVRVDLSLRGDVLGPHPARPVQHLYGDLGGPFSVPAMNPEEIMAEKIRALTYTAHARHLYDVHYLWSHGIRINPDMVNEKTMSAYGEGFDLARMEERLPEKAKYWTSDLRPLLPAPPPPFEDVSKETLAAVARAMAR